MNNTNDGPYTDHQALAMLCGVVPPEYRDGAKHSLGVLPKEPDLAMTFPPRDDEEPGLSPPQL